MISELTDLEDLRTLARIFAEIWGRPGEPPVDPDVLMALVLSGNYVAGADVDGRLVGGLIGWLGGPPSDHLHLHSHILGIAAGSQVRGLGFELKQHQRTWCLERGVKAVEWTFDPLVRRNAYFNLNKLGAEARSYLVNFYGEMADGINAGEESDRILIEWRLDSPKAAAAAAGRPLEPSADDLQHRQIDALLSIGAGGEPVRGTSTDGVVTYHSAHVDGADSEVRVRSDHGVQRAPEAILEVRRILLKHIGLDAPQVTANPAAVRWPATVSRRT